jgi:biotin carboxyl carrier protein
LKATYRRASGDAHEVVLETTGERMARVITGALDVELTVTPLAPGRFRMSDGSRTWLVCVDREGSWRHVTVAGEGEARLEREERGSRRREAAEGSLASPMPGTVVKVLVAEGDSVQKGQDLVVVEAMKMEIRISAPVAGTVKALAAREGASCDGGQILVEVEPA